jgi:hypothetical protein
VVQLDRRSYIVVMVDGRAYDVFDMSQRRLLRFAQQRMGSDAELLAGRLVDAGAVAVTPRQPPTF